MPDTYSTANFAIQNYSNQTTARTWKARQSDIINVLDFGADNTGVGDSTTAIQNALDAAYGPTSSPHGTYNGTGTSGAAINRPVFFPAGKYNVSSPLNLKSTVGAHIYGAGRFTTNIIQTGGGSIFVTNGMAYSRIEAMHLKITAGVCFDLDYDGVSGVSSQSNTFADIHFEGNNPGGVGLRISHSGSNAMGSETLILNCFFGQLATGISIEGNNSLMNTMIGGNIQGSGTRGIDIQAGGMETIHGVSLQQNTVDIFINNNVGEVMTLVGCRTESDIFVQNESSQSVTMIGCTRENTSLTTGYFYKQVTNSGGYLAIIDCYSDYGIIAINLWAQAMIKNSTFLRSDWLNTSNMTNGQGTTIPAQVEISNVGVGGSWLYGTAGSLITSQRIYNNDDIPAQVTRTYQTEGTGLNSFSVVYGGGQGSPTITNGNPAVITTPSFHGFAAGLPFVFTNNGDTLPTGFSKNTIYYVKSPSGSTFNLSSAVGSSAIQSSPGSEAGAHLYAIPRLFAVGDEVKRTNVGAGSSPGWVCTTAGYSSALTGGVSVLSAMPNLV